jgi:hypothetical protein
MEQVDSVHLALLCLMLAAAAGLGLFLTPQSTGPEVCWQAEAEKRLARRMALALLTLGAFAAAFWWNDPVLATVLHAAGPMFGP